MKLNIQLFATTILNEQKSNGSSPTAYYTIIVNSVSNRTLYTADINFTIRTHFATNDSTLGTGANYGLNATFTLNGIESKAVELKSTTTSWSGTTTHSKTITLTATGLSVLQTSIPIKFRVNRTGNYVNDYTKGASLKTVNCSNIAVSQAQAQSVFVGINATNTESAFTLNATQYGLYDVLQIKLADEIITTIEDVKVNVSYNFVGTELTKLNNSYAINESIKTLTATLTTYTDSTKQTNLGSSTLNFNISLPSYSLNQSLVSYSATDIYGSYKNNANDVIRGLSTITLNINATNSKGYTSAIQSSYCNGVLGTINGSNITFYNVQTASEYVINTIDTRNVSSSFKLSGADYNSQIKTINYTNGSLKIDMKRETPTGTNAIINVIVSYYDGENLKDLQALNFNVNYNEKTPYILNKNVFTLESSSKNGNIITQVYKTTITNLTDYKLPVKYSISGTDLLGRAMNTESEKTMPKGQPLFYGYVDENNDNNMVIYGNQNVDGELKVSKLINNKKIISLPAIPELNSKDYYKICNISANSSANARYVNIRCNLGGWINNQMATIDIQISNRDGLDVKGYYYGYESAFDIQTLIICQESDGSHTIYLKNIVNYIGSNNIEVISNGFGDSITYYCYYVNWQEVTGSWVWQTSKSTLLSNNLPTTINITKNDEYVYTNDIDISAWKIGKMVYVQFNSLPLIKEAPNYQEILYGLPKAAKGYLVFALSSLNLNGGTLRLGLNANGNIQTHWTGMYYGESANKNYFGTLIYETND